MSLLRKDPDGPTASFTVLSRRTVEIERDDLCSECQRRFDLIAAEIVFGGEGYPCEDCKAKILARERGFAPDKTPTVTPVRR